MTRKTNPQHKEERLGGVPAPSLFRRIKKGLAIGTIGLSCLAATARAELVEYSFTSAQGEPRTVLASQHYVNPVGNIQFALSAGVDRRVRVSILDGKGKALSTATGKILGAEDRITAAGSRYYGEVLSLPAPSEGTYSIKAEIVSGDNKTSIQEDIYPLTVDLTAPTTGVLAQYNSVGSGFNWQTDSSVWKGGHYDNNSITITLEVNDNQGVANVAANLLDATGAIVRSVASIKYDPAKKTAGYAGIDNDLFPPNVEGKYTMDWIVTDLAGNKANKKQAIVYSSSCNAPIEPWAIFDPSSSNIMAGQTGYIPYTAGMQAKVNPLPAIWRLKRTDWHEYNPNGLGITVSGGSATKVHEDSSYVYIRARGSIGENTFGMWSRAFRFSCGFLLPNVTLAPGVPKTPVSNSIDLRFSDIGWASGHRSIPSAALPIKIDRARYNVQPRDFNQIVSSNLGQCTVPAGATSCELPWDVTAQKGTAGYIHTCCQDQGVNPSYTGPIPAALGSQMVSYKHDQPELVSYPKYASGFWNDLWIPELVSWSTVGSTGEATIYMPANGAFQEKIQMGDVSVMYGDTSIKGSLKQATRGGMDRVYTFNLKNLPEGTFPLKIRMTNNVGSERITSLGNYLGDTTAPNITITSTQQGAVSSLDEFTISLYDNIDTSPKITAITLSGGPANDKVSLSWRDISAGQFKLEYPIMFPSLQAGEEYSISVVAVDAHGNTSNKSVTFSYNPPTLELAGGMDGRIYLPAVTSNFKRNNGLSVISTEPIKLGEGEHVMGTYDVIVSSRSDSEVPVIINGRMIQPGDAATVAAQHNFSTTGGRIDIPVTAAENGKVGKAYILVTTSAPNSPVATVELSFWDAIVNLQSDTWTYRQVIDPLDIRALPAKGTMCRLSLSEPIAQKADPISDPVCLLEWTQMPDEAEIAAIKAESGSDRVVGLQGQAVRVGQQDIKYTLYMYSGDSKIRVGGGSGAIDVVSAAGAITYAPTENLSEVFRKIQSMTLKLKQDEGPKCRLTNNAEEAIRYGASSTSSSKACYLEWMSYPSTLEIGNTTDPMLYGYLNDHKKEEITWRLSIYSKGGTRVNLGSQTYEIDVINPPAPTISIDSKFKVGDNYVLPMNQPMLGYAAFEGEPADLFVGISKDGEQVEAEVFYSGWVRERNKVSRVLEVGHDKGLYGSTVLGLKTYYDLLPDVGDDAELSVISVPSSNVEPNFTIANNKVLDTEILPLTVTMIDRNSYDRIYHSDYGQWSVALFQQVRSLRDGDKLVELTEAKITDENGQVSFDVDMSKVEGSGARVIAIATLIHDIPDYERVVESRPVFTSVLYGGEVDGNVTARRYSGESVYSAYFQFVPNRENIRAARALGDTRWSVSADDGTTWEEFEPGIRPIFARNFEKGIYQIKATSLNRFSGAEFTSAAIELIVYDKPYLELDGPRRLMVGDTANLKVIPYLHGEKRPLEDFVFKWSTDKGETYTEGSNEYSVTQDEPGTFQLRVLVKEVDAPEDDAKAWTEMRINPRFYPVRGPKIGLRAPNKVEVGKEYTVVATARSRVPEMQGQIIGEFVMPDGTRHRGTELTYIPTKEEELEGRVSVSYEAWFEGFEKDGFSSRSTNMRVWEYVWPNFRIRPFGTIRFAPTKVQMSIVQENSATVLEKPEYTWSLPEGAEIIRQVGGRIEFMLNKGGDYEIAASISDARGHSSDVALALNLEDAPAWEIESEVTYSNETMREPVIVSYRPQFSGGHPRDRIVSKKFYVNGELFKEGGFTAKQELRAGKHTIAVEMESRYGQFARDEVEVDVIKNIPPVCSIEVVDLGSKWRVIPQCEDEDGIVRRLEWLVNDIASSGSKYKTFIKSRLSEPYVVQVSALDDSGDSSEPRWVTLNPEVKTDPSEETGGDGSNENLNPEVEE